MSHTPHTRPFRGQLRELLAATGIGCGLFMGNQALAGPTFQQALDGLVQSAPEISAQQQASSVMQQTRPDWMASPLALGLDYTAGDSNLDMAQEWLLSLSTELRLGSSYRYQRQLSDATRNQIDSQHNYLRWEFSRQLLTWWWQWQTVSADLSLVLRQTAALEQQLEWQKLKTQQGESPMFEAIPLQQALAQARIDKTALEHQYRQLAKSFWQWTGLTEVPDDWRFDRAEDLPVEQHPWLMSLTYARQQTEQQQQLDQMRSGNPEISLGLKHLEPVNQLPGTDLLTLGVRVPIGRSGYQARQGNIAAVAQSQRAELDARRQIERDEQALTQQIPALATQAEQLKVLADNSEQAYETQLAAWKQGLISGTDWLRFQDSVWQMRRQASQARINHLSAISDWNLLQGALPQ